MALPRGREIDMIRGDLEGLPTFPLPHGYVLEPWKPGDEHEWLRIHRLSDYYNDFTDETFRKQYGHDDQEWARRIMFLRVADGGPTIGTIGAWWINSWRGQDWGQIHWVAIVPAYQGRGLARPLIAAGMWRMRELGHTNAYLSTNGVRETAVRLYEQFGFRDAEPV